MSRFAKPLAKVRRHARVRAKVRGSKTVPRLSVAISNRHVTAQLIDDTAGKSLVYVSTVGQKKLPTKLSDRAAWAGTEVASRAKTAKIKRVVFDRGPRRYHGRVKTLAESARNGGLEF